MMVRRTGGPGWPPIHPGEILWDEFMEPSKLSATKLARELRLSPPTVNDIIRGRRVITAATAVRLAKYFDTSEQFWLNLQATYDLSREKQRQSSTLKAIHPLKKAAG